LALTAEELGVDTLMSETSGLLSFSLKENMVSFPGLEVTLILLLWLERMFLTMAKPNPFPPDSLLRLFSIT
jgi:hypothetical protein